MLEYLVNFSLLFNNYLAKVWEMFQEHSDKIQQFIQSMGI